MIHSDLRPIPRNGEELRRDSKMKNVGATLPQRFQYGRDNIETFRLYFLAFQSQGGKKKAGNGTRRTMKSSSGSTFQSEAKAYGNSYQILLKSTLRALLRLLVHPKESDRNVNVLE